MEQLLLKPEEAAKALGIGRTKVYELMGKGILPSIVVGKYRRVPADALRRWVERELAEQAGMSARP